MFIKTTLAMLFGLLCLLTAPLESARVREPQDPCANAQTTADMDACAGKEYKKADAALNKTYREVSANLDDPGYKEALKKAQQVWITFRDANCEMKSYINKGGTIYPIVYTNCLTEMTSRRTKELHELVEER
jgi:uncharacterized protein YecT (DUF1311 family)